MKELNVVWLCAAWLFLTHVACSGPEGQVGSSQLAAYRSDTATHKVQVSAEYAQEVLARGGRLTFSLRSGEYSHRRNRGSTAWSAGASRCST